MRAFLLTSGTCLLVQVATISIIQAEASNEPAVAAIATALVGMMVVVTQASPQHRSTGMYTTSLIAFASTALSLSLFSEGPWTWAFAAGVALLTLMLAACRFCFGHQHPERGNLAVAIGFILLCFLPLILSPGISLSEFNVVASALLALNPVIYLSTLLGYDLLYHPWIYTHTAFSDLHITPINPMLSSGFYLIVTLVGARFRTNNSDQH